ncbi:MAG: hypothetical protein AB1938_03820 [Myxococcota bacterium]
MTTRGGPPFLEVLQAARGREVPVRRVALDGQGLAIVIDGQQLEFRPLPVDVAAWATVSREGDRFRFEPGRPAWVSHWNGRRGAHGHLAPGDVVKVNDVVLRYVEDEWPGPRDEAPEALLAHAPHDAEGWGVYRDWLLERGSVLGERMVTPATVDETARWLWPLAVDLQDGLVDAHWENGFVRSLVVRGSSLGHNHLFEVLASCEALRHLKRIEVVGLQSPQVHEPEAQAKVVLGALRRAGGLPSLEQLHLGVVTSWDTSAVKRALDEAKAVCPRLTTTPESLVRVAQHAGRARLEWVSSKDDARLLGISQASPMVLEAGTSVVFRRVSNGAWRALGVAPPVREDAVRLTHGVSGWMVSSPMLRAGLYQPRLNGRSLPQFRLRHGDEVELVPGLVTRFVQE